MECIIKVGNAPSGHCLPYCSTLHMFVGLPASKDVVGDGGSVESFYAYLISFIHIISDTEKAQVSKACLWWQWGQDFSQFLRTVGAGHNNNTQQASSND